MEEAYIQKSLDPFVVTRRCPSGDAWVSGKEWGFSLYPPVNLLGEGKRPNFLFSSHINTLESE